jgi:hypothetical protein
MHPEPSPRGGNLREEVTPGYVPPSRVLCRARPILIRIEKVRGSIPSAPQRATPVHSGHQAPVKPRTAANYSSGSSTDAVAEPLERCLVWLFGYRRLSIRYERYATRFCGFSPW